MILEVDNQGEVDLTNNWSAGGCPCHVDVRHTLLRQLKEEGILIIKVIPCPTNNANLHTKNLTVSDSEKHSLVYTGEDKNLGMS